MTVKFYKYQGTGNDFIMIDNRAYGLIKNQTETIKKLCNRHFGIGADGLIYLQERPGFDFEMVYFNSDGNESTMCGNGGRCLIQFARHMGVITNQCRFMAIDGEHEGAILPDGNVSLKMVDVNGIKQQDNDFVLNTGSPHYVRFVPHVSDVPVVQDGRKVRYNDTFAQAGINVNFVERLGSNEIFVRTYERGVEDETLSCGTGVVASALAFAAQHEVAINKVKVKTFGGLLEVNWNPAEQGYNNIWLTGPAEVVFEGTIDI